MVYIELQRAAAFQEILKVRRYKLTLRASWLSEDTKEWRRKKTNSTHTIMSRIL